MSLKQSQVQKIVRQKGNKINPNDPINTLKQFIKVRPLGIRNIEIILLDLKNLQLILSKMTKQLFEQIVNKFDQNDCQIMLDYLHRYMQYIQQMDDKNSGNTLKLQELIIKKYGPGILIQASARNDTLILKTKSFM